MFTATMTSKGQVTIPKSVREQLGLKTGDRLDFAVRGDGIVEVRPRIVSLLSLAGILEPESRGVSVEDMNKVIRRRGAGR